MNTIDIQKTHNIDDFWFISSASLVGSVCLTSVTYTFAWLAGWTNELPSVLEFFGVALNYACVYLCVHRHLANWWLGIVAVVLLGVMFYQQSLYASAALSLVFFLPAQILGWYQWYTSTNTNYVPVTKLKTSEIVWYVLAFVPAYGLVYLCDFYLGGVLSVWDSAIFTISIVAQLLLNNRKLECWYLWLAVNVISVYVYGSTGLYLAAFQYGLFLLNAGNGWLTWRKEIVA